MGWEGCPPQTGDLYEALDDWDLCRPPLYRGEVFLVVNALPAVSRHGYVADVITCRGTTDILITPWSVRRLAGFD